MFRIILESITDRFIIHVYSDLHKPWSRNSEVSRENTIITKTKTINKGKENIFTHSKMF